MVKKKKSLCKILLPTLVLQTSDQVNSNERFSALIMLDLKEAFKLVAYLLHLKTLSSLLLTSLVFLFHCLVCPISFNSKCCRIPLGLGL